MKSPTPEAQCAEGVSQIQSINNPGQDQREGELNLTRPLKPPS